MRRTRTERCETGEAYGCRHYLNMRRDTREWADSSQARQERYSIFIKRATMGLMAALALAVLAADMALIESQDLAAQLTRSPSFSRLGRTCSTAASTSLAPCLLVRAATPPAWIC